MKENQERIDEKADKLAEKQSKFEQKANFFWEKSCKNRQKTAKNEEKMTKNDEKKAFFDEKSEKTTTKILVSELNFNPEYAFSVQIKDLEKKVLTYVFIGFVVGLAAVLI